MCPVHHPPQRMRSTSVAMHRANEPTTARHLCCFLRERDRPRTRPLERVRERLRARLRARLKGAGRAAVEAESIALTEPAIETQAEGSPFYDDDDTEPQLDFFALDHALRASRAAFARWRLEIDYAPWMRPGDAADDDDDDLRGVTVLRAPRNTGLRRDALDWPAVARRLEWEADEVHVWKHESHHTRGPHPQRPAYHAVCAAAAALRLDGRELAADIRAYAERCRTSRDNVAGMSRHMRWERLGRQLLADLARVGDAMADAGGCERLAMRRAIKRCRAAHFSDLFGQGEAVQYTLAPPTQARTDRALLRLRGRERRALAAGKGDGGWSDSDDDEGDEGDSDADDEADEEEADAWDSGDGPGDGAGSNAAAQWTRQHI
ncbi:MAG: hypothetical protein M1832_006400 [Thelocarpon impressellum]|nr:MAG: hypothetical protein M1832_006400 [Thelocarpon impressellum]